MNCNEDQNNLIVVLLLYLIDYVNFINVEYREIFDVVIYEIVKSHIFNTCPQAPNKFHLKGNF